MKFYNNKISQVKWIIFILWMNASVESGAQEYWRLIPPDPGYTDSLIRLNSFYLDTAAFLNNLRHDNPIFIPLDNQESMRFEFSACPNLSPGLATKYKGIRTFCAQTSGTSVNLDVIDDKIHVFIIHRGQAYFIEPDHNISNLYHLSKGEPSQETQFEKFNCSTGDHPAGTHQVVPSTWRSDPFQKTGLRTYRLALAVTGEFARTHGSTKEAVITALNLHLSRINTVYRIEHGIQFQLVPNNDTLIFMDPANDPYSNGNVNTLLEENPKVLNERIGLNNYDVGHVFGTNAGGVARLGSACGALKGAGVSTSFGVYTGLQFYLIPCHELGHQFNATHIFNFCDNENEASGSAFEPGSGSTIMSYAGASNCGANYVQGISDPYFHAFSLEQVKLYSRNGIGSLCGTETISLNEQPVTSINHPNGLTIPILTPFELNGSAEDDSKNNLTYTWEEMDLGQKSPLGSPTGTAPLFRSIKPDTVSTRVFPGLNSILNNQTNITEVLPSITRPLNFRFTARDNDITGGGVHWSDLALQCTAQSGPFKITSLNSADTIPRSGFTYLTWQVANTNLPVVGCKTVDIYLSEDGGLHFNTLLKSQTPNDGGEWIQFPDKPILQARIKIKGHDHIFFDINDTRLVTSANMSNKIQLAVFPDQQTLCAGSAGVFQILASPSTDTDSLKINILNPFAFIKIIPSRLFIKSAGAFNLNIDVGIEAPAGSYTVILQAISTDLSDTINLPIRLNIISANIALLSPKNNENQVPLLPVFSWQPNPFQDGFRIEVARDPGFTQVVWSRLISTDSTAVPDSELMGNSIYFWRLVPENGCGINKIPFFVFHTLALACKTYDSGDTPKLISATGTPSITSSLTIADLITLKQIRIPVLSGTHEFVGDLELTLRAPSGDSIILWSRQCNNLSNFNLSLDDMAPVPVTCPLTDRKAHQPVQPFNRLIHSSSAGSWTLRVRDAMNGAGGSLDGWSLQLCGALEGQGPLVHINKRLETIELKPSLITPEFLLILDNDSQAGDIKIQVLTVPSLGLLIKNGRDTLKTGSVFTQADLNAGLIGFRAFEVSRDTTDVFSFIAFDEKNNWTGQQLFQLAIQNDPLSPVYDQVAKLPVKWYPNPARQSVYFDNPGVHPVSIQCYSMDGRAVFSLKLEAWSHKLFQLPGQLSGIYILRFRIKNGVYSGKLMVLSD